MSQTLVEIINGIRPRKAGAQRQVFSQRRSEVGRDINIQESKANWNEDGRLWSSEENHIYQEFMNTFGTDFSLMSAQLPQKTRKQIRKKFNNAELLRRRQLAWRKRLYGQAKKSIFEEDVLELAAFQEAKPINKPPTKPNNHIN